VTAEGSPAIELSNLSKAFGAVRALDGVSLTVPRGSVFGFLGQNGAGKTTTLRILTGLAHPTAGTARMLGRDVATESARIRPAIGFLPDVPSFYPWMTATEYLKFAGGLFGLSGPAVSERIGALLELAGLADVRQRIGGYSRGMKQRLGIAQALINAPELLLLDEPTSALDPLGRKDVLDMLSALAGRTTIFFSSHILSDVERVCDTVAILDHGKLVTQAPVSELRQRGAGHAIVVELASGAEALAAALSAEPWVASLKREGEVLRISVRDAETAARRIPAAVAGAGLGLKRLEPAESHLEDVFVELVGGRR
jgi:ABC-2 type transport system ATP-binding protein